MNSPIGRAKGGLARAEKLTPEERSEIASRAARKRWETKPDKSGPTGNYRLMQGFKSELNLAGMRLPCAVVEGPDGIKRVLTEYGITNAILGTRSGASKRLKKAAAESGALLPIFIAPSQLNRFINKELLDGPLAPVVYTEEGKEITAFDASALPAICNIWLKAREAGDLQKQQLPKAQAAEILMRSLAETGIVALVDEATGYQDVRPRDALQKYLESVISKELAAWVKKFPDEFYENIYKLRGWTWPGMGKNRYSVVGTYTRDLVFERIAPGLLPELERRSPKNEKGNRPNKLHQWLTEDIGDPMLAQHMHSLIMFQRLAIANGYGWHRFVKMVDQVLPKKGNTLELPFTCD